MSKFMRWFDEEFMFHFERLTTLDIGFHFSPFDWWRAYAYLDRDDLHDFAMRGYVLGPFGITVVTAW